LAHWLGDAGLGDDSVAVIYDSTEGQNAAMVAWILEYLGHARIKLLEVFFERWKASGLEIRYKPVTLPHQTLTPRLNLALRANLAEARAAHNIRFVDFRSSEEYSGTTTMGTDRPGHVPGALNIDWRDLGRPPELVLKPASDLARIAAAAGIERGEQVVAYCRSGPRAALGYLALRQLGFDVRLFDGSFAQWSQAGLPVEK
jgi:thiosulfate/3-mercaptopyruvate sulfurtransferase